MCVRANQSVVQNGVVLRRLSKVRPMMSVFWRCGCVSVVSKTARLLVGYIRCSLGIRKNLLFGNSASVIHLEEEVWLCNECFRTNVCKFVCIEDVFAHLNTMY